MALIFRGLILDQRLLWPQSDAHTYLVFFVKSYQVPAVGEATENFAGHFHSLFSCLHLGQVMDTITGYSKYQSVSFLSWRDQPQTVILLLYYLKVFVLNSHHHHPTPPKVNGL